MTGRVRSQRSPHKSLQVVNHLPDPKFVVCIKNKHYHASVDLRKLYQVLPDDSAAKHRQLRVIDESGEDYLYPEDYFVAVQLPHSAEKAVLRATDLTSAR